jgi:hypothetical protein
MSFHHALAAIVAGLDLPFGHTLTVWSSAAITSHFFDTPHLPEILTFIAGAIGAYMLLGLLTAWSLQPVTPLRMDKALMANLSPLVAAGLGIMLLHIIPTAVLGFLVASGCSTLAYALALALVLSCGCPAMDQTRRGSRRQASAAR